MRGRPFHGNSPNLIQVPPVAKISSMVEEGCVRARMCVSVCVCLCRRVRDYEQQTAITVTPWRSRYPWQPLLALLHESAQAGKSCRSLRVVQCKVKNTQCPTSQSMLSLFWHLLWAHLDHSGTEKALPFWLLQLWCCPQNAYSQKDQLALCARLRTRSVPF